MRSQTYRATRRTIAIVNANLAESIAGVRVSQAFTREPANIRHFERINRDNLDASRRRGTIVVAPLPDRLAA